MNRSQYLALPAATAVASEKGQEAPKYCLLGQSLIRYDLRKESPVSFERMKELITGNLVVFTNFEAAVQASLKVRATTPGLVHNAEVETLDCLQALGVNLLALSSNHAMDLGRTGMLATIREAKRRRLITAGTGSDVAAAARPGLLRTRQGTVGMIGFVSGSSLDESTMAGPNRPGVLALRARANGSWEATDRRLVLSAIRSAAQRVDWLLAYHHTHEYDEKRPHEISEAQREVARQCIDAGATLYVAHGYPGIRAVEFYKGHPLFHGLGNFIFQTRRVVFYANDAAAWSGILVKSLFGNSVSRGIHVYPVSLRENQAREEGTIFPAGAPRLAIGEEGHRILQTFGRLCNDVGTQVSLRERHVVIAP